MYVDIVPNRDSPPAILLREAWRENGKICKRTVANISDWPMDKALALRALLKSDGGVQVVPVGESPLEVTRSVPYGHVAAVLGAITRLEIAEILGLHTTRVCQLKSQAVLRLRTYMLKKWPSNRGVL